GDHDRAGDGDCAVPGVPGASAGAGTEGVDVAVLRGAAGDFGLPVRAAVCADATRGSAGEGVRGFDPRDGEEGLCAGQDAGERGGAVRLAGARSVLLRVRRCEPYGEGCGERAAGCDCEGIERNAGESSGVSREYEEAEAVSARRLLERGSVI